MDIKVYIENDTIDRFPTHERKLPFEVKVEHVETTEQFTDTDGVYDRCTYVVKSEQNHLEDVTKQIKEEGGGCFLLQTENICKQEICDSINCGDSLEIVDNSQNMKYDTCDHVSTSKEDLEKHIDMYMTYLFKCPLCKYGTNQVQDLKLHVDKKHIKTKKNAVQFGTSTKDTNRLHVNKHRKQGKFKCEQCEYVASWKHNLKSHVNSVHVNLKPFKCHLCDFSANQKIHLKKHIDFIHLNLKEFKCHLCEYAAKSRVHIERHFKFVHSKIKDHKCHLCDYATNNKQTLKRHIESFHLKKKDFKCDLCECAFNQRCALKNHFDSAHLNLKQFKCAFCDYASNREVHLKDHVGAVHFNLKLYKCNECDYSACSRWQLKSHKNAVHLNLKR